MKKTNLVLGVMLIMLLAFSTNLMAQIDYDCFIGCFNGDVKFYVRNDAGAGSASFSAVTGSSNPLNSVDVGIVSKPAFVDIDNDGDQDCFIGDWDGYIEYWKNTGNSSSPAFTQQTVEDNPFSSDYGTFSVPNFVDIDGDGDYDCFITNQTASTPQYFRNTGSASSYNFVEQIGSDNPLNISIGTRLVLAFVDIDNDGDQDCFIGESGGSIKYYKNTGTSNSPTFSVQTGGNNPLNSVSLDDTHPAFVDMDGDGDQDCIIGRGDHTIGTIFYYKNTGTSSSPTFSLQTGEDNPFNGVDVGGYSSPAFVNIDGDATLPVTLSTFTVQYLNDTPILCWTTQSETDNLGFNLYRSENENGFEADEYLLLNNELIPGMGTTFIPTNYSFTDEFMVLGGHTYYYWLQSVSTTNELELFGPITIEIPYEEVITVLSEFNAAYENTNPVLNWTTASETDNLGYFVQRSEDVNGYVLDDCTQLNEVIITGMGTTSYETDYTFVDHGYVVEGHTYWYWLESVNPVGDINVFGPVSLEIPDQGSIPNAGFETSLNPNYPNPFNPETTISFSVKENETGILTIYNLKGQMVHTQEFNSGQHQYHWNAEGLSSGIYFYKLSSPTTNITKKMILMK